MSAPEPAEPAGALAGLPRSSRALLVPGPLAPCCHLGVTLQRHLLASALRYALYHLGLPVPEVPPVRIERLRLYLETKPLLTLLGDVAGGREIVAALVDPAGSGPSPTAARTRTALAFHRLRLWRFRPPRTAHRSGLTARLAGRSRAELWGLFRRQRTALVPALGSALLAELVASVERRAARRRGEVVPRCRSRAADRLMAGRPVALRLFGAPDLRQPSWAGEEDRVGATREAAVREAELVLGENPAPAHRYRGRYRLELRAGLDLLRPTYLALAHEAERCEVLARADDAFFFPLDLAEDLTLARRPAWLDAAVATNRAELVRLFDEAEPPELLAPGVDPAPARRELWEAAPLLPIS